LEWVLTLARTGIVAIGVSEFFSYIFISSLITIPSNFVLNSTNTVYSFLPLLFNLADTNGESFDTFDKFILSDD